MREIETAWIYTGRWKYETLYEEDKRKTIQKIFFILNDEGLKIPAWLVGKNIKSGKRK